MPYLNPQLNSNRPSNIMHYDAKFTSGISLVNYCVTDELRDTDYTRFTFNEFKFNLSNCNHFFDIMTCYIKFIQNTVLGNCNPINQLSC